MRKEEEEEGKVETKGENTGERSEKGGKEVEAKEEEEKDTESVDVDDGGTRLVAEDAEKEEESLRFFREFQTSRSARGPDPAPPADGNGGFHGLVLVGLRSSAENGFCFMDSSSSDSDTDGNGNGASAATTSSSSSSAEWAERWEREQWERKHGGASGGAFGGGANNRTTNVRTVIGWKGKLRRRTAAGTKSSTAVTRTETTGPDPRLRYRTTSSARTNSPVS